MDYPYYHPHAVYLKMTEGAKDSFYSCCRPAVSKHLRILQEAGLVTYSASGARNIFSLRPAGFREARVYLDLFWDEALANFQRVIEEEKESEL